MFYGLNIRPYSADPVIKTPDYVDVLVMSSLSDFYRGALHISVLFKVQTVPLAAPLAYVRGID